MLESIAIALIVAMTGAICFIIGSKRAYTIGYQDGRTDTLIDDCYHPERERVHADDLDLYEDEWGWRDRPDPGRERFGSNL